MLEFSLLGPLTVRRHGKLLDVGTRKQRALLIHLVLRAPQTVPVDRLIDALWDDDPPPQARVTLRSYVSNLRRALHAEDADLIVTQSNGYSLQIDPEHVDATRFERDVAAARERLMAGDPLAALSLIDEALTLWRGEALADLGDSPSARSVRTRLDELRLSAQEERFDALLALERHAEAVASLEAFTIAEPLRERARAQLMIALYRSGRAPDALRAFQQFRESLVEELGLDPSPQLQRLADRILQQASDLVAGPRAVMPNTDDQRPSRPLPTSHLVGRTHERAELRAAMGRLVEGEGGLLLIAGEPGIGKTALLEELAKEAAARDVAVQWGRCHETQGAPPFWPWLQIVRGIAATKDDAELEALMAGAAKAVAVIVDDIAERLSVPAPPLGTDLESARFQLYDALATFLLRAAERRPLLLLLDDLHWADTPTLQTLAFLTPLLASSRLLVAGTYRDVESEWPAELEATLGTVVRDPAARHIALAGLQPAAVAELAHALTGERLSGHDVEALHQRTAGNPFFVRELSRLLAESTREGVDSAIPSSVRHVLARRMSRLGPDARTLLSVASVVGRDFDVRLLAGVVGISPDAAIDAAAEAASHRLVEAAGHPTTLYRFVHALVRETIYDGIEPARRARLHADVADAIEADGPAAASEVAEHLWRAVDFVPADRGVRCLVAAADEALSLLAFEQAETYLRRALAVATSHLADPALELPVRVRLVQLLISVHGWASPLVSEMAGPAQDLARASEFKPEMVPLWVALLSAHTSRGNFDVAGELAADLVARASVIRDAAGLAAGHTALAHVKIARGEAAEALEHLLQGEHHAKLAAPEHLDARPNLLVASKYLQAVAHAYLGDALTALEVARESIDLARSMADPLSHALAHMMASLVGMIIDDVDFTAETTAEGLELCDRNGFSLVGELLTVASSWARARRGEDARLHAEAMSTANEAIQRQLQGEPIAKFELFTAETYALAGDLAAAHSCVARARALAARTGEVLPARLLARAVQKGIGDRVH